MNGLGLPVNITLTPGQQADITQAKVLLEGYSPTAVIVDKAYDSDDFAKDVEAQGAQAVIPPRQNRTQPRDYDRHLYKERNLVERFINRIKHYRRIATRYEKTARNFLGFVHVASLVVLLM